MYGSLVLKSLVRTAIRYSLIPRVDFIPDLIVNVVCSCSFLGVLWAYIVNARRLSAEHRNVSLDPGTVQIHNDLARWLGEGDSPRIQRCECQKKGLLAWYENSFLFLC